MRVNLTKKEIINSVFMQIGFSKKMSESILEDILSDIVKNLKKYKVVKISNFGTFHIRFKKSRVGRNPKTKEEKIIKERNVVLFKPSKDFKKFINENNDKIIIISGGFYELIYPVVSKFGIKKENIFANTFIYDKDGKIIGVDKNNPLSKNNGKVKTIKNIKNILLSFGQDYIFVGYYLWWKLN